MTGAVSGRTPRQMKKDSAACSTSMPRPSETTGGAVFAGKFHERRFASVHHVVGQCAGSEDGRRQGKLAIGQAGGSGVDDNIELL